MRHRRNNTRWSYRLLDVHGPGQPSGACVVAPLSSVADIVDVCATVGYVNSCKVTCSAEARLGALRASAVFTAPMNGLWRRKVFIVLRTLSGPLPPGVGKEGAKTYKAPGSTYIMQVCENEPSDVSHRYALSDNTAEGSLCDAVRTVCALIHESVDTASLAFKDAVSSRLRYFKRCNSAIATHQRTVQASDASTNSDDSDSTDDAPSRPPSRPPAPRKASSHGTVVAFQKPNFSSVEDLFFSFATHVIDNNVGLARRLNPLNPVHLTDKTRFVPQALVFCHAMC